MREDTASALHSIRAHEAHHRRRGGEVHLRIAGEKRLRRRSAALELHVREFDSRHRFEQHRREMRRRAVAGRGVEQLPRVRLGVRDHLAQILERHGVVHADDRRPGGDAADRRKILVRVVGEALVQRPVDRHVRGVKDGVAVGRRARDVLVRDVATRAGLVLDDHRLAEVLGELVGREARQEIARAARRIADHELQRLGWIRLRRDLEGSEQRQQRDGCLHFFSASNTRSG